MDLYRPTLYIYLNDQDEEEISELQDLRCEGKQKINEFKVPYLQFLTNYRLNSNNIRKVSTFTI